MKDEDFEFAEKRMEPFDDLEKEINEVFKDIDDMLKKMERQNRNLGIVIASYLIILGFILIASAALGYFG